jgi:hypothetical protein
MSLIDKIKQGLKETGSEAVLLPVDSSDEVLAVLKKLAGEDLGAPFFTLYLPTKKETVKARQKVLAALTESGLPDERRLTIELGSMIQKTWRVINRYTPGEKAPEGGTENRRAALKALAAKNDQRLSKIEEKTHWLVLMDQARRLNALLIWPFNQEMFTQDEDVFLIMTNNQIPLLR